MSSLSASFKFAYYLKIAMTTCLTQQFADFLYQSKLKVNRTLMPFRLTEGWILVKHLLSEVITLRSASNSEQDAKVVKRILHRVIHCAATILMISPSVLRSPFPVRS